MPQTLKQALAYHNFYNQKWILEIKNHFEKLPIETYPLFCHILNAHQIWNARILNTTAFDVHKIHTLQECFDIDNDNYKNSLTILDTVDLSKTISYVNSKGDAYTSVIADIVFHIINHSTHHKAQIASQFRQVGITPLTTDYIFYKRETTSSKN